MISSGIRRQLCGWLRLALEELLDDVVALQEGQLLGILTLHNGLILVHWVRGELVQVAEVELY